jgi:hypothetical protein
MIAFVFIKQRQETKFKMRIGRGVKCGYYKESNIAEA